jgi:5-methylcytosine-specific restriction endonuclease McrA
MRAADNDLTPAQWAAIQAAWGGCAYCGETDTAMQKDCVQPLSRGGRYTLMNVVPACRSCNASKGNEEVTHWMRRRRLDEPAFLVRLYEIRASLAVA